MMTAMPMTTTDDDDDDDDPGLKCAGGADVDEDVMMLGMVFFLVL